MCENTHLTYGTAPFDFVPPFLSTSMRGVEGGGYRAAWCNAVIYAWHTGVVDGVGQDRDLWTMRDFGTSVFERPCAFATGIASGLWLVLGIPS